MCEGHFNKSISSKAFGCALVDIVIIMSEKDIFVTLGICQFGKLRGFLRTFCRCLEKYCLYLILMFLHFLCRSR